MKMVGTTAIISCGEEMLTKEIFRTLEAAGVRTYCLTADELAENRKICDVTDILVLVMKKIPEDVPFDEADDEMWTEQLKAGVREDFEFVRAVVPGMKQRKLGRIISVCSEDGCFGHAFKVPFAAGEAARIGFCESLGRELTSDGICSNIVTVPVTGEITESVLSEIPAGRAAEPEDISGAVLWLASDAAGYISGQTIAPNGGRYTPV